MTSIIGTDPLGNDVVLTNGAKNHILRRHPEMRNNMKYLNQIIRNPDMLLRNERRRAYISIKKHPYRIALWIVMIYGEDGKILTAYKTKRPHKLEKQGELIYRAEG